MQILKINKNNITSAEYDENLKKWIDIDIKELPYPFPRYFSQVIELSEDLTIYDLMMHIKNHAEDINYCFYSYLKGVDIKEYVTLMEVEPAIKSVVDTIEFYWTTDLRGDEYYLYGTYHGLITKEEELAKLKLEDLELNSFKMDYTPLNEWKHCAIFLDESIKASAKGQDNESHIIKLRNRWSLFEFLQFFLYDLTYFGNVEQQKKEIEEFDVSQKKYEGFRSDPDFALKLTKEELTYFIEEIKATIKENKESMQEADDNEDFLKANDFKKENVELEIELNKMIKRMDDLK
jgi:hypothetical protein